VRGLTGGAPTGWEFPDEDAAAGVKGTPGSPAAGVTRQRIRNIAPKPAIFLKDLLWCFL